MAKYRKKPVVIEAFKWTGDQYQEEDPIWIIEAIRNGIAWFENNKNEEGLIVLTMVIKTLEGNHRANRGDYIIKGVKGEIYPCKPDIFEMTYEKADSKHNDITVKVNLDIEPSVTVQEIAKKLSEKIHKSNFNME